MYHYVMATEPVELKNKTRYAAGQIVASARDKWSAGNKVWDLRMKQGCGNSFTAIESEEKLLKDEIYPEILATWKAADYERRAIDTMKSIIDPEWTGQKITPETVAIRLENLQLSVSELKEKYEAKAQAELDEAKRKEQELAEQKARLEAITNTVKKERSEVCFSFPAVRGIQAEKEYYVAQIPYGSLVKLFVFDEEPVPAELRAQRTLNESRAKGIAKYMLENPSEYVLPALTASVSAEMSFEPSAVPGASDRVGMLHIPIESMILINDGQHRRKGIEMAMAERPELRNETAAVTIFFDEGLARSQQIFADINSKQVKPSSAINALFDKRNPFNAWVLKVLDNMPEVKSRIDFENSSIGAKSNKLWSLIAFKKFITNLTDITEKNISDREHQLPALEKYISIFFRKCEQIIPRWSAMMNYHISAPEVRNEFVIGHAVWLEALGMFGRQILASGQDISSADSEGWKMMEALKNVDPMKSSKMWTGRCVVHGKMQKTSDGVKSTAAQLFRLAEIELTCDMQSIEKRIEQAA